MFRRRLNGYEWFSILVFLAICAGSVWYLVTTANMIDDVELGFHGNFARALGIGVAVILAIALNVAFIKLARAQTAMEQAEAEDQESEHNRQSREQENRSTDPRDSE